MAAAARIMEQKDELPVERIRKGKKTFVDIRPLILSVTAGEDPDKAVFRVRAGSVQNLRPDLLVEAAVQHAGLDRVAADDAVFCREKVMLADA